LFYRPAGSWRLALIGAAIAGLLVLGFFGLFSIGLPLFLMGLVAVGIVVGQSPITPRGGRCVDRGHSGGRGRSYGWIRKSRHASSPAHPVRSQGAGAAAAS
jgi:hypothetical protein